MRVINDRMRLITAMLQVRRLEKILLYIEKLNGAAQQAIRERATGSAGILKVPGVG